MEEEERLGEVERVDRGGTEVAQVRGQAPVARRVKEFQRRGGGEAGAAAEAEDGDCAGPWST